MWAHSPAFAEIASRSAATAGISRRVTPVAAAMCMADGKVSFEDCEMFAWSLGWTGCLLPSGVPTSSQLRLEITS